MRKFRKKTNAPKIAKSHLGSLLSSSVRQCPEGQHSHDGICYKVFHQAKYLVTLDEAEQECDRIGGRIAEIQDRETWWVLMMLMTDGINSFWIDQNSDDQAATMYVVDTDRVNPDRAGLVANLAQDFRLVSPQWDIVDRRQRHRFICQFD